MKQILPERTEHLIHALFHALRSASSQKAFSESVSTCSGWRYRRQNTSAELTFFGKETDSGCVLCELRLSGQRTPQAGSRFGPWWNQMFSFSGHEQPDGPLREHARGQQESRFITQACCAAECDPLSPL